MRVCVCVFVLVDCICIAAFLRNKVYIGVARILSGVHFLPKKLKYTSKTKPPCKNGHRN